jgi:hypothetical protein
MDLGNDPRCVPIEWVFTIDGWQVVAWAVWEDSTATGGARWIKVVNM